MCWLTGRSMRRGKGRYQGHRSFEDSNGQYKEIATTARRFPKAGLLLLLDIGSVNGIE